MRFGVPPMRSLPLFRRRSVSPAYYDREADIVYVELGRPKVEHSLEMGWGLIDMDRQDRPLGIEIWRARGKLPADLLEAMPEPRLRWHEHDSIRKVMSRLSGALPGKR